MEGESRFAIFSRISRRRIEKRGADVARREQWGWKTPNNGNF